MLVITKDHRIGSFTLSYLEHRTFDCDGFVIDFDP